MVLEFVMPNLGLDSTCKEQEVSTSCGKRERMWPLLFEGWKSRQPFNQQILGPCDEHQPTLYPHRPSCFISNLLLGNTALRRYYALLFILLQLLFDDRIPELPYFLGMKRLHHVEQFLAQSCKPNLGSDSRHCLEVSSLHTSGQGEEQ